MAINLYGTGQLRAQEAAVVLLVPQELTLNKGQISSVVVRIEGATNIYGVQINLSFDAGKIKVLDRDEANPGVQILAGDFLALDEGFVASNNVNNETGQLTFAHSLLFPAEPASGSGTLVEFEVEALETGSTDLLLSRMTLASPDGAQLPVRLVDNAENNGGTIVPTTAASDTAATPAVTAENLPVTTAATADTIQTPTSTAEAAAESAAAAVPTTASPDIADTRMPAGTESAAPMAVERVSTEPAPAQTSAVEAEPEPANQSTAEPVNTDQAAEIAAVPLPVEKEDSDQIEAQPSPALTVIGQNRNVDDFQAQPASPAPIAKGDGIMEGPYAAIGLLLLIVALIAIWFLRRLLVGTK